MISGDEGLGEGGGAGDVGGAPGCSLAEGGMGKTPWFLSTPGKA